MFEFDKWVKGVIDVGINKDVSGKFEDIVYFYIVVDVVRKVVKGEVDRGLLICGIGKFWFLNWSLIFLYCGELIFGLILGMGVVIFVNKVFGIWVFVVYDLFFVECFIKFNNV